MKKRREKRQKKKHSNNKDNNNNNNYNKTNNKNKNNGTNNMKYVKSGKLYCTDMVKQNTQEEIVNFDVKATMKKQPKLAYFVFPSQDSKGMGKKHINMLVQDQPIVGEK